MGVLKLKPWARLILTEIAERGNGYGLDLHTRLERTTGKRPYLCLLYPRLRWLEQEGLLRSWESEPLEERGWRPRRYYAITAEGLAVVAADKRAAS